MAKKPTTPRKRKQTGHPHWLHTTTAQLRKVPWAVVGAFLVGIFTGAASLVGAMYSIGEKVGVVELPEHQEARNGFSRGLILLMGTRSNRARQVILAYQRDASSKNELWNEYAGVVDDWNNKRLYHKMMLRALYGHSEAAAFDHPINSSFSALHRCLLQATGRYANQTETRCLKTSEESSDLDVAVRMLNALDRSMLYFANSIRPTR